ncbi:DUF1588 domain-containing protein [Crateriforma spongiae]|uniref:DUF1588 domain-containing protein n=1 Tax=Crateriforma spongiae TaxID=2724528 RepID=UPI0014459CCD|nr:DUF1588 domain-containing protein [Crateriforma spongiae]
MNFPPTKLAAAWLCGGWIGFILLGATSVTADEGSRLDLSPLQEKGRKIYQSQCADCHGAAGQGNEDYYPDPLVGDDSSGQLAELIADTMPEGEPELCEGDDALAVAQYIYDAFYSEAAQIRNRPPRQRLQRLTANQLRQSFADLYATVEGLPGSIDKYGLKAQYFDGDRWKKEKLKIERVDPFLDFDFDRQSPGEGISAEAFYIQWNGGLKVDQTGRYELVVNSTLSMIMDFGSHGDRLIDNHVQSGDKTEFRRSVWLDAGRIYPLQIQFIQRKRKTELPPARIRLAWVPPGDVEHTIPTRNLVADWVPSMRSIQAPLPPDDRSYGYERGLSVDPAWESSTTDVALEFATLVHDELLPRYRRDKKHRKLEKRQAMKKLLADIVSRAFRSPLSDADQDRYIDQPLQTTESDLDAIKRVMLMVLKSPRFLYPTLDIQASPSRQTLNRLSLILHDSLPTESWQIDEADQGKIQTVEEVRRHARRLFDDHRTRAKLRDFYAGWLNLDRLHDLNKDPERFPGFTPEIAADVRRSLMWTLNDVAGDNDLTFQDLFTTRHTLTSALLGDYYGDGFAPIAKADSESSENQSDGTNDRVGLIVDQPAHLVRSVDSDDRYGLLNHPYLMGGLAYHDATSPIHRGVFLIRYMLGRTLRPPNAAFAPLSIDLHPDLTTRQRVELQTGEVSCQVCHSKINGLGFTLENYDPTGRFRELDAGQTVDASGGYESRSGESQSFRGADELAQYLANGPDSRRGFIHRLFQHFVKQPPAAYGPGTLDRLEQYFAEHDFNVRELVIEIATIAATDALEES